MIPNLLRSSDQHPADLPLARLERADLIRRLQELEETYQFKHNLIQESVYASLLKNERKSLHLAAARALESEYADQLDENSALLAKHYAEAGNQAKTYSYSRKAGEAALRVSGYAEAVMHFDTSALLIPQLSLDSDEISSLHQTRGRTLELLQLFDDAKESYHALYESGKRRGDKKIEMEAMLALATLHTYPNTAQDLKAGEDETRKALALAREIQDPRGEARAHWVMLLRDYFSGKPDQAVKHGRKSLEISDRFGFRDLRAYVLNDMSRALITTDSLLVALESFAEARTIFQELDILPMLADNLASTAETVMVSGDLEASEKYIRQGLALCEQISNLWNQCYITVTQMQIAQIRGEIQQTLEYGQKIRRLAIESGFFASEFIAQMIESNLFTEMGDLDQSLALLDEAACNRQFELLVGWLYASRARLLIMRGELEEAEAIFKQSTVETVLQDLSNFGPIFVALCATELAFAKEDYGEAISRTGLIMETMNKSGIRFFDPEIRLRRAQSYIKLGNLQAARDDLLYSESIARRMGARLYLWQILATLADLAEIAGDAEQMHAARRQAKTVVQEIVERTPDTLSKFFLSKAQVQRVLASA